MSTKKSENQLINIIIRGEQYYRLGIIRISNTGIYHVIPTLAHHSYHTDGITHSRIDDNSAEKVKQRDEWKREEFDHQNKPINEILDIQHLGVSNIPLTSNWLSDRFVFNYNKGTDNDLVLSLNEYRSYNNPHLSVRIINKNIDLSKIGYLGIEIITEKLINLKHFPSHMLQIMTFEPPHNVTKHLTS